ncbi:VOC family protein [Xylanibacillus composti]|uniref:Extradiol dioxygenase n=1 Tax=Xylanibacillus composti TaxID=1572762 RepID=A0A8J4H7N1_9BACL|nr:VOC family protein [Xylanibacillus composti]MDT9723720.1 VOC family protein [Xylanibacillus composti]GIQ71380.1 extradiol dioxygenase [Xylanibacillus composti]
MRLDNVRLLVSRFDECLIFYRDVLGLKLTWGELGGNYANFDTGDGLGLGLYKKELMSEVIGTTKLPVRSESQDTFVCIFEVDDLEQTVKNIENKGGRCLTEIQDRPNWGIRAVHLRDPDGNLIELYSELAAEKWSEDLIELSKRYE